MRRAIIAGLVIVLAASTAAATAQTNGFDKIEARYAIIGKNLTDPGPNEKKDRAAFFVSGAGAKKIYEAMPGKSKKGVCSETDQIKMNGNLACSRDGNAYSCSVAVMLKSGASASAFVC